MKYILQLLKLLRPQAGSVALGIFLSLITVLANMGLLALSSWFIASMAIAGATGVFFNYALPAAVVRALALARTGGRYLERMVNHNTTFRVLANLRIWFYRRILPLAPARLSGFQSGDLLSRIQADVDTLDDFYLRGLVPVVVAFFSSVAAVLFVLHYSALLAVIELGLLIWVAVLLPAVLSRAARESGEQLVESASQLRSAVVSHTTGMAELISYGAAAEFEARIREQSARHDRLQWRLSRVLGTSDALVLLAMLLALWFGFLVALPLAHSGNITPPSVALLGIFMLSSFEAVTPIPEVARRFGEVMAAARRLFEISRDPDSAGASRPVAPDELKCASVYPPVYPPDRETAVGVQFRGVRFRYAADEPWVYDGLDLEIEPGSKIAVTGPTGTGKSSLVNLLVKFYQPQEGTIRVGGTDLETLSQEEAAAFFSVSEQRTHLFHTTIRENLLLSRQDASESELWDALDAAQIGSFVASLPEGLDTIAGETGTALSVGQGRRIGIARALLARAPVLILDEPTESLDSHTAGTLIDSVFTRAGNRTLILITHLTYGLDRVDRVIQIEKVARRPHMM